MQVVCTLAEGHYFNGVAALCNSLVHAGFKGTVVVGYRGELPPWVAALERDSAAATFAITDLVRLHPVAVGGSWHLNNCKPRFIEQVLFEIYQQADLVFYFDTDIVIKQSWDILAKWVRSGVVAVLDPGETYMSPHHIYREEWRLLAARKGLVCRDFTGYVNGGCVGISRAHADFAAVWSALTLELERDGADMRKMKNSTGKMEYARMDQDVLNATIMATTTPIALLGCEAMGLYPWTGEIMPHAMWNKKPWQRNYILDALRGFPPGRVHLAYWQFVDGPIHPFKPFESLRKRMLVAVGYFIGLMHTRSFRDL